MGNDTVRDEPVGPRDFNIVHIRRFAIVNRYNTLAALSRETFQPSSPRLELSQACSLLV